MEGWALHGGHPIQVAHAWLSDVEGRALDPTWRPPGTAYVGLPVRGDVAADLMDERGFPLLHGPDGLVAAHAVEWLRDGVPAGVLADVGRDVTPRLPASAHQVVGQRAEGANQVS